ncbi:MBL fold metallo-hydrolase [Chloroflexota bacterium]
MKLTDNLYVYPENGMLDCNTCVIKDDLSVIIDPGFEQYLPALIDAMRQDGIEAKDIDIITNTHLHADHCWANDAFKELSGAKIQSHPLHEKFYETNVVEVARFFGMPPVEFKPDGYLEGDKLNTGNMEFVFIHSPGHSLDSICFYAKREKILICGDVIFSQNTGRVDMPGGNAEDLKHSIEELSELEIEYLLPGHMNIVTGAGEVKNNFEFVRKHVFNWLL